MTSVVIPESVTSIGAQAFYNCESLTSVYYGGTAEDWDQINIYSFNDWLTNATRYYYLENASDAPTAGGNYWHYVDGVPTAWEKGSYIILYYLQNIANDGYSLSGSLTEEGEGIIGSSINASPIEIEGFTFNESASTVEGVLAADGSLILKLYYTRNTYDVILTNDMEYAGTIAGEGSYEYGEEVTLTATAFASYVFAGWYNGEEKVADSAIYSFTVFGTTELTAKFKTEKLDVILTNDMEYAGTLAGEGSYEYGEEVTLTATDNDGYLFIGWYDGETQISDKRIYTFNINNSVMLVGKWLDLKQFEGSKEILSKDLGQAELANFDSEEYVNLFANTRGTVDSFEIEYLESYQGRNGVIKISGTNAANAVLTLMLPKAMTAMKMGPQTTGGKPIKEKDEQGNDTEIDKIFDLTDIVAEIYVVNSGTSTFGFFQSLVGDADYGWGGKEIIPTYDTWKDYSLTFITADHLCFAVGAGDFEFYVAGIYEGTEKEVISARLASTLGEDELANFDSQD